MGEGEGLVERVRSVAETEGVDHIVEVAFAANVADNVEMLRLGGSIATYATDAPESAIPFWAMVFKNVGSVVCWKRRRPGGREGGSGACAECGVVGRLEGVAIEAVVPLADIAIAHEHVERGRTHGRVIVST